MPIWLRKFTFKKISEFYEKEKEEYDKVNKKGTTVIGKNGIPNSQSPIKKNPSFKV